MSWLYNAILGAGPQEVQVVHGSSSSSSSSSTRQVPSEPPPSYEAAAGATDGKTRGPLPRRPLELPALNLLRKKRVILASASPRRKQLLASIGLTDIEVVPSDFAEDLDKSQYTPLDYVRETAVRKCQSVYQKEAARDDRAEPAIVIAADTVIASNNGEVLEKPHNESHHFQMLRQLRDSPPHKVYTAVVAMAPLESLAHPGYALESIVEATTVTFDALATDELLASYVRTREGADKAGGYAIQGTGSILIEKIEGSFDNVIGLPLRAALKVIEKVLSDDEFQDEDEDYEPPQV